MTLKFNELDIASCYFCGEIDREEIELESVTLREIEKVGKGSYTFFVCPECKRTILSGAVGETFFKRYTPKEKKEVSE